ncbi:MAG: uroporphyrinogen-III synthase [Chromatiales bacterium]|jgi:uroporphyrinogen-III synthase
MACSLESRGVLVTRAVHQASGLAGLIESQGGRAICFPALEIGPARDPASALELLRQGWDLAIFISPNAVRHAFELLAGDRLQSHQIAAVGEATARALQNTGMPADLMPQHRYDSEGLLALPELQQMHNRRVLIVRGQGGRSLLGDSLRARGAKVGYAEVYRRLKPMVDPTPLLQHWQADVDIVTATSVEVLDNLMAMLGESGASLLHLTPLLVISERMAMRARELGFKQVLQASGADDASVMKALCEWFEVSKQ